MSALLAAAPGIIGAGIGAGQAIAGLIKGRAKRPEYEIPASIRRSLGLAESEASQTSMPGYSTMLENIQSSTARGLNSLKETSSNILGGVSDILGKETGALKDLGYQNALFRNTAKDKLSSALNRFGEYEDKEFQMNEMQPYLDRMEASRQLKDAGLRNIMGGLQAGIGGYFDAKGSEDILEYLKNKPNEYESFLEPYLKEKRKVNYNQQMDVLKKLGLI
jgi:hypothetical protein